MRKIISVNYFDDPNQYIKNVRNEWEKFIKFGEIDGLNVRDEVLKSWDSSIKSGVPYSQLGAKLVLDKNEMEEVFAQNEILLAASETILEDFSRMLKGHGNPSSIINLCSQDTIILKTLESGIYAAAENQNLLPGAILNEKYSGTTGVSMVRNTLQPYAIYGSEHFNNAAKSWCCAAAPIKNFNTNELMGILSLSGDKLLITSDTMTMITFVARTIEKSVYIEQLRRSEILNEKFKETLLKNKADLILAVDIDCSIINTSKNQHPLIENFYPKYKLKGDLYDIAEKTIHQCLVRTNIRKDTELDFNTNDYNLTISPIYYCNILVGIIIFAHQSITPRKSNKVIPSITNAPILIGKNQAFNEAIKTAVSVAKTDASVLLIGETGVGKEGFARTICHYSNRTGKPFITLNCGAIPKELIGSELFGYAPGAFTGALVKGSPGKIEAANGGTIFLDEIGELPLDSQTYLLRVLEEKELARLGSNELIRIDVRIIAATNANLQEMIRDKLFRSDLYFRLNIIEIKIPPLRERLDDLADLISFFSKLYTGHDYSVADDDLLLLKKYSWAGNIRELRNVIHSAVILNRDILHALNDYVSNRLTQNPDIERHKAPGLGSEIDNKSMIKVINACNGNMSKAAKQLGVARSTLYRRLNSNK